MDLMDLEIIKKEPQHAATGKTKILTTITIKNLIKFKFLFSKIIIIMCEGGNAPIFN
jgi:hypothetical protein